jgi:hypothetical protein
MTEAEETAIELFLSQPEIVAWLEPQDDHRDDETPEGL